MLLNGSIGASLPRKRFSQSPPLPLRSLLAIRTAAKASPSVFDVVSFMSFISSSRLIVGFGIVIVSLVTSKLTNAGTRTNRALFRNLVT